ncbi:MAG: TRAP transporter substrate-binding protein [Deltaproteobacteria bacterium]|nr:TRAP transporter substrate-binding protein [Deltaproteobacteria bacterium]
MTKRAKVVWAMIVLAILTLAGPLSHEAAAKLVIKLPHGGAATKKGFIHNFGFKFVELAAKYSNNEIEIREFPARQLGTDQTLFQKVRFQDDWIVVGGSNNLAPFAPSVGVLTLPYLFTSLDDVYKLINGPFVEVLNEKLIKEAGIRALGYITGGFRHLTNSKRPVCSLEDLKGLKIRVPKNALMIAAYKSWGINPVPMAWSEVFTALQQQVIDGQDNPYISIHANKFYEVQKYITEIQYLQWSGPIVISERYYQGLSPDIRKTLEKAAIDAALYQQKWVEENRDIAKAKLMKKGMSICVPKDGEEWIKRARATWPQFYDKVGGKANADLALEYMKK